MNPHSSSAIADDLLFRIEVGGLLSLVAKATQRSLQGSLQVIRSDRSPWNARPGASPALAPGRDPIALQEQIWPALEEVDPPPKVIQEVALEDDFREKPSRFMWKSREIMGNHGKSWGIMGHLGWNGDSNGYKWIEPVCARVHQDYMICSQTCCCGWGRECG